MVTWFMKLRIKRWQKLLLLASALVITLLLWRLSVSEPSGGFVMNVPQLNQGDYTETVCVIKGQNKTVKSSGCGAVSVALVGEYLTGKTTLGPQELFQWAYDNGYYYGDGLSHQCLKDMGELYGLKSEWVGAMWHKVFESLKDMRPVIAHMGNGHFSNSSGHYIVLTGLMDDGRVVVHDPGKKARSGKAYDWDFIVKESKGATPLMIVTDFGWNAIV